MARDPFGARTREGDAPAYYRLERLSELEASRDDYAARFGSAALPSFVLDERGIIRGANEAAAPSKLLGHRTVASLSACTGPRRERGYSVIVSTTRNRALPLIIRSYAAWASSNG